MSYRREIPYLLALMCHSLFNTNVVKLFSHYEQLLRFFLVVIQQTVMLQGPLRHPEYGMLIG